MKNKSPIADTLARPLVADRTRCYGYRCKEKESCLRFLTITLDDPLKLYSYVNSLIPPLLDICKDKIPLEK